MAYLRHRHRQHDRSPPAPAGLTVRQAVGILLARPGNRTDEEQQTVEQLRAIDPEVRQAVALLAGSAQLIRESPLPDAPRQFEQWMGEAASSRLPEFVTFVAKLRQDRDAVVAGLRLSWSQGQTEGQVTKVKLIKRSKYGRAKFDLLRQRILYASAAA